MLPESGSAKMHALAAAFSEVAFQGVAVGAGEREAGLPERGLGLADIGRGLIAGHMIADLSDEPGSVPASRLAGVTDDPSKVFLIKGPGQGARRVLLVGVAFALVPEHRAEAMRSA